MYEDIYQSLEKVSHLASTGSRKDGLEAMILSTEITAQIMETVGPSPKMTELFVRFTDIARRGILIIDNDELIKSATIRLDNLTNKAIQKGWVKATGITPRI